MLLVGLTGGLATGKTQVGRQLAGLGCLWLQADVVGHEVLMPGQEAYEPVVQEFGPQILDPDGQINRRRLAGEVFGHPERLQKLNSIVHPCVRARVQSRVSAFGAEHPDGIAVVEAAILIETGTHRAYDRLILVTCSEEQQITRAMSRDGLTREQVAARLRRQLPLEEKIKYAGYVIDNSGSIETTAAQTRAVFDALRGLLK